MGQQKQPSLMSERTVYIMTGIFDRPPFEAIEVLNVKVHVFVLLIFATLPDCSQNQTAVSDTLRLLSDF